MRYENKKMKRIGSTFENEKCTASYDLSDVRFLHMGVDTIKQLYNCTLKQDVLDLLSSHYDTKKTDVVNVGGIDWCFRRASQASGYQYILKNLEIGFVVLFKSFYKEADETGPHLKIEVSPEAIGYYGLEGLTNKLHEVGNCFADTLIASGVAVHLAVDAKGLELPEDFEEKMVTRAKRQMKVNGISNAHFSAAGAAFVYGHNQTYMFGQSSGLQLCVYDKTEEIEVTGKKDYWEGTWRCTPSVDNPRESEYQEGDQVRRIEFRFSHRVIKEFENGNFQKTGQYVCIREPRDLKKHLRGLWLYALNNFRLQHSTTYIHPIWQLLMEDVEWYDLNENFSYSRAQKVTQDGKSKRNVAMYMGNYLKLAARKGLTVKHAVNHILNSGLDGDLAQYFGLLLYGNSLELESMLTEFVEEKLLTHRLNGVGSLQSNTVAPF